MLVTRFSQKCIALYCTDPLNCTHLCYVVWKFQNHILIIWLMITNVNFFLTPSTYIHHTYMHVMQTNTQIHVYTNQCTHVCAAHTCTHTTRDIYIPHLSPSPTFPNQCTHACTAHTYTHSTRDIYIPHLSPSPTVPSQCTHTCAAHTYTHSTRDIYIPHLSPSPTVPDQQPVWLPTWGGFQRRTIRDSRIRMNLLPFEIRSSTALRRLQGGKSTELCSMALIRPYSSTEPSRSYRELLRKYCRPIQLYYGSPYRWWSMVKCQNYVILKVGKACRDTSVA